MGWTGGYPGRRCALARRGALLGSGDGELRMDDGQLTTGGRDGFEIAVCDASSVFRGVPGRGEEVCAG